VEVSWGYSVNGEGRSGRLKIKTWALTWAENPLPRAPVRAA
jgi:hypothetical protein